jgi:hypothetical protein
MTDLAAAAQFIAGSARLLERRRFGYFEGDGSSEAVVRALAPYQNADGGFGHLEPDIRTPASQPTCVLYALEILHEVEAGDLSLGTRALDWLETVTNDDGGVPFILSTAQGWPMAPWFAHGDTSESSLTITAAIAAQAHRLGLEHPWRDRASEYCWEHLEEALTGHAYTMRYVTDFLDAVPDRARADAELVKLAPRLSGDGVVRVEGGTEDEALRPLDLAPWPGHAARRLFSDEVIEHELDRMAAGQQDDGGWTFTWLAWNPAGTWEWRGIVTVLSLRTLRAYGRIA